MKPRIIVISILTFALGICAGVILRPSARLSATAGTKRYAMNVVVSGVPFWTDPRQVWEDIGKKVPDVTTVYGGPSDTDPAKQIEEVEALISQHVNGIVIAPADAKALVPTINKAVDAGIPVVTAFADAPSSKRLAYVGLAQKDCAIEVGNAAVQRFIGANAVGQKAVISLAKAGIEDQAQRAEGFKQVIKLANMELVQMVEDQYDEAKGAEALRALLVREPNIRVIFGCDSRSAIGAATAVRESGRQPGSVVITGWDYDQDNLNLIKQGWVQLTAAQYSAFMTQLSFSILDGFSRGYLYPRRLQLRERGIRPVPEKLEIPVALVDSQNVDGFLPKH